jgi:CHAT domain-containing protein
VVHSNRPCRPAQPVNVRTSGQRRSNSPAIKARIIPATTRLLARVILIALTLLSACTSGPPFLFGPEHLEQRLLVERFTTGRLAHQTEWRPCEEVDTLRIVPLWRCDGTPEAGTVAFERLARLTTEVATRLRSDSSSDALRLRALLDLRWMHSAPAGVERAIAALEQARLKVDDPALLNDLAVSYLALAERDQRLVPVLRALDLVESALERDSTLTAALFNRALILQRLYMAGTAKRAWRRYLDVERSDGWRREAGSHQNRLTDADSSSPSFVAIGERVTRGETIPSSELHERVRRSPDLARTFAFALFAGWGKALLSRDQDLAARHLDALRATAATLDSLGSDRSVALALATIDREGHNPLPSQSLALAHVTLEDGMRAFARAQYTTSASVLLRARDYLRDAGSPAARWAEFYRAASLVSLGDYAAGDRAFESLLTTSTPEEPALVGKVHLALGVSQVRRGNYERANAQYRAATPHIERTRERVTTGFAAQLLAEGLGLAGRVVEGYTEGYRALRLLSTDRRSTYFYGQLEQIAAVARAEDLSRAALAIAHEMLEVASSRGSANDIAMALCARAQDEMELGRSGAAEVTLSAAERWATRLPAGRGTDRVRARVMLARGKVTRARDPNHALRALTSAIDIFRSFENDLFLPEALYEASRAASASGEPERARGSLLEAIRELERQHAAFQTTAYRASFAETVERVFDEMIAAELRSGNPEAAFEFLERARIAAWPATQRSVVSEEQTNSPSRLDRVVRQLPDDLLLVEYALLRDRVVIWIVSNRGWNYREVSATRDSVARLVQHLARDLDRLEIREGDARSALFDVLLRPVAEFLRGVRRIAIVPDRELYRVPFAALWDRDAGRYVLQDFEIRTSPSATFQLAALATASSDRGRAADSNVLVVGAPALDSSMSTQLSSLPGAAEEASRVARLYPDATLLTGAAASRAQVLRSLRSSSIVHFAGHAVFNEAQPELSFLALAPDGDADDGTVRAWEIGELRLSNARVVVLSACSTLSPRVSRMGAVAGLAFSFLRAGAPATVSTLWDVSDQSTADLLVDFHRRLAVGLSTPEALRLAQLDAMRSTDPRHRVARSWAAFTYTGH